jgi:hypothetical protein
MKGSKWPLIVIEQQAPMSSLFSWNGTKQWDLEVLWQTGNPNLVDSGSVATFISDIIAAHLQFTWHPCEKVQYKTADESILDSGTRIP